MRKMASHTPLCRQVLVVVHGPARVAKSAVKRARDLAGDGGLVVAVGNDAAARKIAQRTGSTDAVAAASGHDGVLQTLQQLASEPVLVIHDDASLTADEWALALRQYDPSAGAHHLFPLAASDTTPFALVGRPGELADLLIDADDVRFAAASTATIEADIRHDGRCGTADAAEPASRAPLVIASLIVRDEQNNLDACLESIQSFVDGMVVCDTGSTDDTVDIATSHGATVIQRAWRNDFAWARNEALAAVDEADWILWIDADERLTCDDVHAARLALRQTPSHVHALGVAVTSPRRDGPTSVGLAQRLFRRGATFSGAIHEELVNHDGAPVPTEPTDIVGLTHLGYAETDEQLRERAHRNLAIARAAFAAEITPKSALDFARSLAFAGSDLAQAIDATARGLATAETTDPRRQRLLSLAAGFHLELNENAEAFEKGREALRLDGGDDVAAAVCASAGVRLGHDAEVIDLIASTTDTGALRVPLNRITALALALGAAIRAESPTERRLVEAIASTATSIDGGWIHALGQLADTDPQQLGAVLRAPSVDHAAVTTAAYEALPLEAADRLVEAITSDTAAETSEHQNPFSGISLSFGLDPIPCDAALLASSIPPGRRVLDWSKSAGFGALVDETALTRVDLDPAGALTAALARIAASGDRFDAVVGGVPPDAGTAAINSLSRLLDPSGVALLWDVDDAGAALSGASAEFHTVGATDAASALLARGLAIDPISPNGVTTARPVLDQNTEIGDLQPAGAIRHLHVQTPTPLSGELQLAHRVSIPSNWALSFSTDDESVDADVTLVSRTDVIPEPRWLQALIDNTLSSGCPSGTRLIDPNGSVVHCGLTEDGRPIGFGESSDGPLLRSDRRGVTLAPPFVITGGHSSSEAPVGDLLASSVAVAVAPDSAVPESPSLAETLHGCVVLLDGPPPGAGHPDERDAIDKALQRLSDEGVTTVYQWAESTDSVDQAVAHHWRNRGVILVPPSPDRYQITTFRPDISSPRSDALVTALQPSAIVHLTVESLEWDYQSIAGQVPDASIIYAGPPFHRSDERADITCALGDLADAVLDSQNSTAATRTPVVPAIDPITAVPGLVSIVIPVHNRWDLTEACLSSIAANTQAPTEVIVVDNGSTDGTGDELAGADVTVIRNQENLGFPIAVNQGIAATSGEYVCVLNNDTEVTAGWLDPLLAALDLPGTAMVGPRSNRIAGLQCVPDGPKADDPTAHEWAATWIKGRAGRTWPINRLIGFCLLLRRSTFEEFGGLDEGFGIGNHEDDELGNRLMAGGLRLRVVDDSVVIHHGSATFTELGLDYAAVLHQSSRHLDPTARPHSATGAVVLSDGDPIGAAASAASALHIADRVRIVERQAIVSTELAAAAIRGGGVDVVRTDWTTEAGAARAFEPFVGAHVIILGSGELVDCSDWGAARAELDHLTDPAVEINTPDGGEVRIVPPAPSAIADVGSESGVRVRSIRLVTEQAARPR